jgi:hypothetical protein
MMFLPKPDRRKSDRLNASGCLACRATSARVIAALRTDYTVYFRCVDCGNLWSMPKPAWSAQNRELDAARARANHPSLEVLHSRVSMS